MSVWIIGGSGFLSLSPAVFLGMEIAITFLEDTQQKSIKI